MGRNSTPEVLRAALDAVLRDGEPPTSVRRDIWASWRRSATSGLSNERFAAHEIEERLLDDTGIAERVMMRRFLRERSRGKHPMLVANARLVLTNTAAERLVRPEDEARLRAHAEAVIAGLSADLVEIVFTNGNTVALRCEPILDGRVAVGVVMYLEDRTRRANRPALGLAGLTDTERAIADLVAEGLTNRQIGERVFVSRHTVDFHLRSIFRKVDVTSRIELARQIVGQATMRNRE